MLITNIDNGLNVTHHPNWLNTADELFEHCLSCQWQSETIKMFGKEIVVPRKIFWMADEGINYQYSGISHLPIPWTENIFSVKQQIEDVSGTVFNSVLGNYYRDGNDYMGWHSDNEKELGKDPIIASISLGATRKFVFKHKQTSEKHEYDLQHGDLLIMGERVQTAWNHALPKTKKVTQPRINLTFREVKVDY